MTATRKNIAWSAAVLMAVAATIACGWVDGRTGQRWGESEEMLRAAQALRPSLPERCGSWRLQGKKELEADVVRMLQCSGYLSGVYEQDRTGLTTTVTVILGPPGPIAAHTAEICYSAHDYHLSDDRTVVEITSASGGQHTFWNLELQPQAVEDAPLRVMYAWGLGDRWQASARPRFSYGGKPYLYKIQLASTATTSQAGDKACEEFLREFLDPLQQRLVPPR